MHIEFKLPTAGGGTMMLLPCSLLHKELAQWCEFYGYRYVETHNNYSISIYFDNDHAYTLFALTWNYPKPCWVLRDD